MSDETTAYVAARRLYIEALARCLNLHPEVLASAIAAIARAEEENQNG